jgi:alanine racemase
VTPPEIAPRVWAEIDRAALTHNIGLLKRRFGPARIMAVVKADAYGHGMPLIAPLCAELGLTDFGVATAAEGAALRPLLPPGTLIYLLGPALPSEAPAIVFYRLTPLVSTLEMGQALSEAARAQNITATAHLDLDTGIGRAGAQPADAPLLLAQLDSLPNLQITGLATHFADADDNPADAQCQHELFLSFLQALGPRMGRLLLHAANSPAALNLPSNVAHRLLRPGLLLYGIEPTPGLFAERDLLLKPVLSLKTRVTLCRALPAGATLSYGRTYTVPPGGGMYATLGVGYGDGYPRGLSNRGSVLIHGQHAPICGRVCMDQVVVDVSHIPGVLSDDIATLIGSDGSETLTAGGLAALLPTTPHEITTRLTARVPRFFRDAIISQVQ